MKENILNKIKNLKIGRDTEFALQCGKYRIEMKLFEINKVVFLAISGGGVTLIHYIINKTINYERILKDIDIQVFKSLNLNIEDCKFVEF